MWWLKGRRRKRLRREGLPAEQARIIERTVPYARLLTDDERTELHGHTRILLHEKYWEGCGSVTLTDEIRVTIASQAALLLLNRDATYYPKLTSVLVYPARYVVETTRQMPDGTVIEGPEMRAGESWSHGNIVLSWDDTVHGAVDPRDGHNVVLHEFAHQLDLETGSVNGVPVLDSQAAYEAWSRVCQAEFDRLQQDLHRRRRTILRPYGATNPAEFFAVATETFFERPLALREHHAELYEQLRGFYHQDPATRLANHGGSP